MFGKIKKLKKSDDLCFAKNDRQICVYGHYGACNHGNEAIVRGLVEVISPIRPTVYSFNKEYDIKYSLDQICDIEDMQLPMKKYSLVNIIGALQLRILNRNAIRYKYQFKNVLKDADKKIYLLEMGDQYCENDTVWEMYAYLNRELRRRKGITIALGGSINADRLKNENIIDDLKRYSLVVVRESKTYDILIEKGLDNIECLPDLAFQMQPKSYQLPRLFADSKVRNCCRNGCTGK